MKPLLPEISPERVCAVVLAGGRGSRMGGIDKGLQPFRGQALAWHAVQRLQTQHPASPGCIAINANRNVAHYAQWGLPVWSDASDDFSGPLAGILSALNHCAELDTAYDYLLTVPCDSPLFPPDLLERLASALARSGADIAMVLAPESDPSGTQTLRAQPVFCLMHTRLRNDLRDYMAQGGRKIDAWTGRHTTVEVAFDQAGDDPRAFANANTLAQLQQLEQP